MLQIATKQGEEKRATARPRRHGASVRQPWTQGEAAGRKLRAPSAKRKSRSQTNHAVTRVVHSRRRFRAGSSGQY